jgi:hypothetical protein
MYWAIVELPCHVTLPPILAEADRKPKPAQTVDFLGDDVAGKATRETPVRAEPHPICAFAGAEP